MATLESVKAKIQGLINKANRTTSREDTQLSPAVDALIAGYGSGGEGGFIDVTELPKPYKLYFADKGEIQDGEKFLKTYFSINGNIVELYYVDKFPVPMAISGNGKSVFYVLKTDGVVYFSNDGITPMRIDDPSNLPLLVCHGLIDSVDYIDTSVKGFYTEKGGEIKEDAVYRLTEEKETQTILWVAGYEEGTEINMPIVDFFKAIGVPVDLTITVVETLPETMPAVNEDTFTFPCYVLESTGIAYVSLDGTSATAIPVGAVLFGEAGFDKGWIDSADEIVVDPSGAPCLYTIRPGITLVPKGLFVYSDGWYELEKTLETTEKPREPRVYVITGGKAVDWLENFVNTGGEVHGEILFVDALPMDTDGIYVLNATGIVYYVENGQAVDITEILSGTQGGWVDSIEEMDVSQSNRLYALRGSKTDVIYKVGENGTTNEVYIHENDEWQGFTKGGGDTPDIPESSGMELNIAYGDTAPEDTSKLWVKTSEPSKVNISSTTFVETLPERAPSTVLSVRGAAVGSTLYMFGSSSGTASPAYYFNTETGKFMHMTFPRGITASTTVSVGTKVYIFITGSSNNNYNKEIYVLDTETYQFTKLDASNPASNAQRYVVEAVGNSIYIIEGYNTNAVYRFDIESGVFTTLEAKLPTVTYCMGSVVSGARIYLFGGHTGAYYSTNKCYYFDTDTETFTTIANAPKTKGEWVCYEVDGVIYLTGGRSQSSDTPSSAIYAYDIEGNTFATFGVQLPKIIQTATYGSVGTKLYLFCPYTYEFPGDSQRQSKDIFSFTPYAQTPNGELEIFTRADKPNVNLMSNEKLGLKVPVCKVFKGNENNIGEEVEAALYKNNSWTNI